MDEDSLVPLVAIRKNAHGRRRSISNLPAPAFGDKQLTELRFRKPGVKLYGEGQVKVPEKFEIFLGVF